MSWYIIVLLIIFYIVMWIIISIALTRLAKSSDEGWVAAGLIWPLILLSIPLLVAYWFVVKIVNKYGYKKE